MAGEEQRVESAKEGTTGYKEQSRKVRTALNLESSIVASSTN